VNFTDFLALNLLAQFSRQIVVQILSSESKKSLWESRSVFTLNGSSDRNPAGFENRVGDFQSLISCIDLILNCLKFSNKFVHNLSL
jgi:hypothetical protein